MQTSHQNTSSKKCIYFWDWGTLGRDAGRTGSGIIFHYRRSIIFEIHIYEVNSEKKGSNIRKRCHEYEQSPSVVELRYLCFPSATEAVCCSSQQKWRTKLSHTSQRSVINREFQTNKVYKCLAATCNTSPKRIMIAKHPTDVSPSRLTLWRLFSADACQR